MIKWIKRWWSSENKISYVYVIYWFDWRAEKRRMLAFRDKEEAIDYIHELKDRDVENSHKLSITIDTVELI